MNENTEIDKTIRFLKSLENCFPFKVTPGVFGKRGISDILICYSGLFMSIEMKVGSNKPSAQQVQFMKKVQIVGGGLSFVCWSCEEVKMVMQCIKKTMVNHKLTGTLQSFREDVIQQILRTRLKAVKKKMVDFQ